ncbi:MAG TPA: hypothetical protein ENH39_05305 [Gammaproteobacteria bacterium]|nr:hypothetical protein [Gammaproteobacteria bacterium]
MLAKKYIREARKLTRQKKYDLCIEKASAAIRTDPKYVRGYRQRGGCYFDMKRFNEALVDFNSALKLNASDRKTLNGIAFIYATAGDPKVRNGEKALEYAQLASDKFILYYKKKGRKAPNPYVYKHTLAAANARSDNFADAKKYQLEAIKLLKNNIEDISVKNWDLSKKERARVYYDEKLTEYESELALYERNQPLTK